MGDGPLRARTISGLENFFLPAKTTVLMSQFVTHRDPRFFPDPLRFDPERFTPGGQSAANEIYLLSIRRGSPAMHRRIVCMDGRRLAAGHPGAEVEVELVPGTSRGARPLITLRPKYGMRMEVEAREQISRA